MQCEAPTLQGSMIGCCLAEKGTPVRISTAGGLSVDGGGFSQRIILEISAMGTLNTRIPSNLIKPVFLSY